MNRTIEQWQEVGDKEFKFHSVLSEAINDLQELAQQLENEENLRAEAQQNKYELVARAGAAEGKLNYALNELEFIANTNYIDAALDPDRAIRVAKAAVKFIKEQTK